MHAISAEDLKLLRESQPTDIKVDPRGFLGFATKGSLFGFRLEIPNDGRSVAVLASNLVDFEELDAHFGSLLWFTSWDTFTPQIERCGLKILEQMRRGYGVTASLENAPAQIFRSDESVDAQAFLTLAMIFGWSAFFAPHGTRYFAYARPNGSLYLVTDDESISVKLSTLLQYHQPVKDLPSYLLPRRVETTI